MKAIDVLLKHAVITQEQYDKAVAKAEKKDAAREKYKKNKAKLTKAELMGLLDELME
jgi:hypothetical protein